MLELCKKKFRAFSDSAEFRPGAYAVCCSKISIGKRVVVRPGSILFADPRHEGGGITIEDDVLLGSGVQIYVANHLFADSSIPIIDQGHGPSAPVTLRAGCWISAGAIILPGVTIGENSVVGAGSVVTRSIPSGVVVAGNPARIIREIKVVRE
jgi:acetyltransferase-like isoleucine patch superfamily enzyme